MILFNEKLETEKILLLLHRSTNYFLHSWTDIDKERGLFGKVDPLKFNMRDVKLSSPVIEYVIKPHVNILTLLCCCIRHNFFPDVKIMSKEKALLLVSKGIRWMCDTHVTGNLDVEQFLERKRWGENWRSSNWTTHLGICLYLVKEFLDPGLIGAIQRVIVHEANRFIKLSPPSGFEFDSKIDENAQDVMLMAWAINLFPEHPNVTLWEKSLSIWSINIASSIKSKADHTPFLGRSIASLTSTCNLYPDMTAETHGFFNPEILTYTYWVVMAMLAYVFNKKEPPPSLTGKGHQETFDIALRFYLPNGMIYAPGSQDLPLFIPRPITLLWGIWNRDSRAQRLCASLLNWMDTHLPPRENGYEVPWVLGFDANYEGWELYFQSQVGVELGLLSLIPEIRNQYSTPRHKPESLIDSRRIYPYVQILHGRNTRSTRSVAWKSAERHPSIGLSIHTNPDLLLPYRANMLGIPTVDNSVKSYDVIFHHDTILKNGFETFGRINYCDASNSVIMTRDIRVFTWGDDGILIFDRLSATKDLYFYEQYLSPVYLVNDIWTGDAITLTSGSLHETFQTDALTTKHVSCPSYWATIEEIFLFQFVWGKKKGLTYIPGNKRNAPRFWNNCRVDMLAVLAEDRLCKAGDIVYETGFFVGIGKNPRPFKSSGNAGEFFKGIVIMDSKTTIGID